MKRRTMWVMLGLMVWAGAELAPAAAARAGDWPG